MQEAPDERDIMRAVDMGTYARAAFEHLAIVVRRYGKTQPELAEALSVANVIANGGRFNPPTDTVSQWSDTMPTSIAQAVGGTNMSDLVIGGVLDKAMRSGVLQLRVKPSPNRLALEWCGEEISAINDSDLDEVGE